MSAGAIFGVVLIGLIAIFLASMGIGKYQTTNTTTVKIGNAEVNAEIADNDAKRIRGLMFRDSLGKDEGMLFVFGSEGKHGIWMMNMSFPIDVIWMDKDKKVVFVEHSVPPCDALLVCPIYEPLTAAKYILEVNSGYAKRHGIEFGKVAYFQLK
jgi:hypothetical protein